MLPFSALTSWVIHRNNLALRTTTLLPTGISRIQSQGLLRRHARIVQYHGKVLPNTSNCFSAFRFAGFNASDLRKYLIASVRLSAA